MKLRFLAALCCGFFLTSSTVFAMEAFFGCCQAVGDVILQIGVTALKPTIAQFYHKTVSDLQKEHPDLFVKFSMLCQVGHAIDAQTGGALSAAISKEEFDILQRHGLVDSETGKPPRFVEDLIGACTEVTATRGNAPHDGAVKLISLKQAQSRGNIDVKRINTSVREQRQ